MAWNTTTVYSTICLHLSPRPFDSTLGLHLLKAAVQRTERVMGEELVDVYELGAEDYLEAWLGSGEEDGEGEGEDEDEDWCEAGEHERTIKLFQTCLLAAIFLLGMAGNAAVMATLAARRRLRRTTDIFLSQLALADVLLLLTLPLQVADVNLGWVFSAAACKAVRACYAVNTYSGLLQLACVSVDRYVAVARPQDKLRLHSRMLVAGKMVAAGVWLVAALLSLPELLFSGVSGSGADAYCGMLTGAKGKMAADGAVTAVFGLSFLVMAVCYSLVARVLWAGSAGRARRWRHQRTLKLMVALVLLFLVFQLPHSVVLSLKMAAPFCALLPEYVTRTLAYARCCLNPVMYVLLGVRFRNQLLKLLPRGGCLRARKQCLQVDGQQATPPEIQLSSGA
ncbi:C-C chemokine receptor type 10 [Nerophis lumbriciformis]|uniref:C-C chemokine receptor type 10 n=1 Tax=Nerophis lumbriciformis TaxID=546530 RepID=UPI002AE00C96|nr:C-C chemokine receptor type 10-like [Nerophis lumbriciformis]